MEKLGESGRASGTTRIVSRSYSTFHRDKDSVNVALEQHREYLRANGVTDEVMDLAGIYSSTARDGICYPYRGFANTSIQFQPIPQGELRKYLWDSGTNNFLNVVRFHEDGPVLIVEGTTSTGGGFLGWRKRTRLSACRDPPCGTSTTGTSSRAERCSSASDGDVSENRDVYIQAKKLGAELKEEKGQVGQVPPDPHGQLRGQDRA